ncbi:hypothetical protein LXL04_009608 [Taraxacum kok-saghyz]
MPIARGANVKPWYSAQAPRTFADAVADATNRDIPQNNTTYIKPTIFSKDWDECVMVGEPISLQHIAEFPSILPLDGNPSGKLHYIGGTNILIKFPNKESTNAFYAHEHNWNRWLKWLRICINDDLPQERLAWKTTINEEVNVRFEHKVYRVGVVEYDWEWKPYDQPTQVAPEIEEDEEEDDMSEENYDDADDEEFKDAPGKIDQRLIHQCRHITYTISISIPLQQTPYQKKKTLLRNQNLRVNSQVSYT